MDMVGNARQWAGEFDDEHSKLLRMAPGYDRSGGVGFRCGQDAQ
jgi:hypothetical protein